MATPFIGQLMLAPYNFAPKGWAFCQGQLLAISQNTALFSLLGVNYGGDGKSTFGLPNLQGAVPIGAGQGPGLSPYTPGEAAGATTVTLLSGQCPPHSHNVGVAVGRYTAQSNPVSAVITTGQMNYFAAPNQMTQTLNGQSITVVGSNQPHDNMMPYLGLNWCIALQGVFPTRS